MSRKLIVPQVTADSTDAEIIQAIEVAGEHRYSWRRDDHAEPGDNNPNSWIIPNDIGYSTARNTTLLKRLKRMTSAGLLEIEYTYRLVDVAPYGFNPHYESRKTYPRFRVAKGAPPTT